MQLTTQIPPWLWPDWIPLKLSDHQKQISDFVYTGHFESQWLMAQILQYTILREEVNDKHYGAIIDVVYELSTRLYKFWKSAGMTADHCTREANRWADALMTDFKLLGLDINLRVIEMGVPKDDQYMLFMPGRGTQVLKVESWTVLVRSTNGAYYIATRRASVD